MASVQLERVVKSFGGLTPAVNEVDLSIRDGEFVALLGPSGCGKSTLLRMIAGLEQLTSGSVRIDELVVNDVPGKKRDVAMVFQNYALYPQMSVRQNIRFPLELRDVPRDEIEPMVEEMAALLEIDELLDRKPGQLSGGQQQRVAMARALVRRPAVLLMDEPLSNLDARLRDQMRSEIRSIQSAVGITTIYVTHDQVEALTMADRIVVLRDGVVQQVATPASLYENPANTFVAGFVGSPPRSLVTGSVRDGVLSIAGHDVAGVETDAECDVIVGVRAEQIELAERGVVAPQASHLPGTVLTVEPLGSEALVTVRIASAGHSAQVLRVKSLGSVPWRVDDEVAIHVTLQGFDVFDAADGARIDSGVHTALGQ